MISGAYSFQSSFHYDNQSLFRISVPPISNGIILNEMVGYAGLSIKGFF